MNLQKEIWAKIAESDLYEISTLGNFQRLDSIVNSNHKVKKRFHKGRILKPSLMNIGYKSTRIWVNGIEQQLLVHRLVANTFIPNPLNKPDVNHKNGIRSDNRVENLEWVTASENAFHAINVLKKDYGTSRKKVLCTNTGIEYESCREAAQKLNLSRAFISNICRGVNIGKLNFKYV